MSVTSHDVEILRDAPIPTWFKVGGPAEMLARPRSIEEIKRCLDIDPTMKVLGDGANLLVGDEGVAGLVVSMDHDDLRTITIDEESGLVSALAGARLSVVINACVTKGLAGLETLAGIPASVGGAVIMNAGGAFGEIADRIHQVHVIDRDGVEFALERDKIAFGYRHSGLGDLIVTRVEFMLTPGDTVRLQERRLEILKYKKNSQPMGDRSAGCAFKNPELTDDIDDIGQKGERVSAGLLIDRAGCKGFTVGGAAVSDRHANFITTFPDAKSADVIAIMVEVAGRVHQKFGVKLKPEVIIWRREP